MTSNKDAITKFGLGGASCMSAACTTNWIDVTKTKMQLTGEGAVGIRPSLLGSVGGIIRKEGILTLLTAGLKASVLREGSYSTLRLGLYDVIKESMVKEGGDSHGLAVPLWKKMLSGGIAGAVGSAIANPTDLIKVRMQADINRPLGSDPRYRGVIHAASDIWKKEGFAGLYKGVGPTVYRATILTATQVPSYDEAKHRLLHYGVFKEDAFPVHVAASMFAGLVAATATSPIDVVKTRVMSQPIDPMTGQGTLYSSTLNAFVKIAKTEGLAGFFKGWTTQVARIGPHTLVTFLIYEKLRELFNIQSV